MTVLDVTPIATFSALWRFSGPTTLTGANAPALEVNTSGHGWASPDDCAQVDAVTIQADYLSADPVLSGDSWRVLSAPPELSPAVSVPESGFTL